MLNICDLKSHAFDLRTDVLNDHAVVQIGQSFPLEIGFLVAFHGDSVLVEGVFVSLVARDGLPAIEVDVKLFWLNAPAPQLHVNALQIALPPIRGFKANPHRLLVAIVSVEIAAIQTEL